MPIKVLAPEVIREDKLDTAGYRSLIEVTTRLNRAGPDLARLPGVHAITDSPTAGRVTDSREIKHVGVEPQGL